ncbi:hypothetical protein TNCV_3846771 [Trichonephila clavipes]|nr:hypothetical protein TNCV_3846771 [Trichonephila clavipes]
MPNVNTMSDHPKLFKQLALEVIDGISLDAAKIHTDGSKGETNTTGSGVLIEIPGVSSNCREKMLTMLLSLEWSTFCNVWGFPVRRLLHPPAVLRLCTDLWTHGSGLVSLDQNQFETSGTIIRKACQVHQTALTSTQNRYLELSARRLRQITAPQLAHDFVAMSGRRISRQTSLKASCRRIVDTTRMWACSFQ